MTGRLHPDDVQAIAPRVVELLRDQPTAPTPRLLDAAQVADMLGLSRDAVYVRADELGAVRLGDGKRPRLRFDPAKVAAALSARDDRKESQPPAPTPQRRSPRRAPPSTVDGIPLLPVRGAASAS
jgi:hypothetical protein